MRRMQYFYAFCSILLLLLQELADAQPPDDHLVALPVKTITEDEALRIIGSPTKISLTSKNGLVREIYDDFFRQAALPPGRASSKPYSFETGAYAQRISIHLEDTLFWEAARTIGKQTDFKVNYTDPPGVYWLTDNKKYHPPFFEQWLHKGAFSFAFMGTHSGIPQIDKDKFRFQNAKPPQFEPDSFIILKFAAFADPKFYWHRPLPPRITEARDDNGNSLFYQNDLSLAPGFEGIVSSAILRPGTSATRITLVKGMMRYLVATRTVDWIIEKPMKAKGRFFVLDSSEGAETYTIEETKHTPLEEFEEISFPRNEYEIRVEMTRAARQKLGPEMADPRVWAELKNSGRIYRSDFLLALLDKAATLQDTTGNRIYTHTTGLGGWKHSYKFNISHDSRYSKSGGPPARLIWRIPSEMHIVEIPFELKDVPLPQNPNSSKP